MSWKRNIAKEEYLERCGITAGLPLFESIKESKSPYLREGAKGMGLPDWIWTGSDIKAEIYNKMHNKFAQDSLLYLHAIIRLGGKATDHEVKEYFNDADKWPLHIVSARRNYFTGDPFYIIKSYPGLKKMGPKGSPNIIWCVDFAKLYQLIIN